MGAKKLFAIGAEVRVGRVAHSSPVLTCGPVLPLDKVSQRVGQFNEGM